MKCALEDIDRLRNMVVEVISYSESSISSYSSYYEYIEQLACTFSDGEIIVCFVFIDYC